MERRFHQLFYFKCFQYYCIYSDSLRTHRTCLKQKYLLFFKIFFRITRQGLRKPHETSEPLEGTDFQSFWTGVLITLRSMVYLMPVTIDQNCFKCSNLGFFLVISPIFYGFCDYNMTSITLNSAFLSPLNPFSSLFSGLVTIHAFK